MTTPTTVSKTTTTTTAFLYYRSYIRPVRWSFVGCGSMVSVRSAAFKIGSFVAAVPWHRCSIIATATTATKTVVTVKARETPLCFFVSKSPHRGWYWTRGRNSRSYFGSTLRSFRKTRPQMTIPTMALTSQEEDLAPKGTAASTNVALHHDNDHHDPQHHTEKSHQHDHHLGENGCCDDDEHHGSSRTTNTASRATATVEETAVGPMPPVISDTTATSSSADQSTTTLPVPPTPTTTFYRRSLPNTCVALSSRHGRIHFASAMRHNGLKSFFHLMEQHSTQSEPAYCGISTLVIALNALAVDPGQIWKGSWRWYEESMLNCCVDLEEVKTTGITLAMFNCLAICQGLNTQLHYVDSDDRNPDQEHMEEQEETNDYHTTTGKTDPLLLSPLDQFRQAVMEACVESDVEVVSIDDDNSNNSIDRVLIASYCRKGLGQTGSGHFSPIAAYDRESDSVLIMDTARFKYGAHWVKLPLLFDAMKFVDPTTNRSRGYVTLIHRKAYNNETRTHHYHPTELNLPTSILLRTEMKQSKTRRHLKIYLESLGQQGAVPSYLDIVKFCTKNGVEPTHIWEMTQPQLHPIKDDADSKKLVDEVQSLLQQLLRQYSTFSNNDNGAAAELTMGATNGDSFQCRSHNCRAIHLQPEEATMIVFLACLDVSQREAIVYNDDLVASDRARNQLLAEAKLYRYAIDTSDQIQSTSKPSSTSS